MPDTAWENIRHSVRRASCLSRIRYNSLKDADFSWSGKEIKTLAGCGLSLVLISLQWRPSFRAIKGRGSSTVANYNTEQQIVISGDQQGLDGASTAAAEAGGKVIPLNVSIANHSPLLADAVPDFSAYMDSITFQQPQAPVYCNVSASPENDAAVIKKIMARQIISRVRWYELISNMIDAGVDVFIEAGPKTVLKGMLRKIVPKGVQVTALQFDTPESLHKCCETLGFC